MFSIVSKKTDKSQVTLDEFKTLAKAKKAADALVEQGIFQDETIVSLHIFEHHHNLSTSKKNYYSQTHFPF